MRTGWTHSYWDKPHPWGRGRGTDRTSSSARALFQNSANSLIPPASKTQFLFSQSLCSQGSRIGFQELDQFDYFFLQHPPSQACMPVSSGCNAVAKICSLHAHRWSKLGRQEYWIWYMERFLSDNWTEWPDVMSWCSSVCFVFCEKVWHDLPSAGFSKERRLRLIPHCQGVPCFELNPFLRSIHFCCPPKKVNPPPCFHGRYPGFPGARAGQAGPCGEWIAGINTSQLTMMMMMANTWRKALWLRKSSGGFSRASKVDA